MTDTDMLKLNAKIDDILAREAALEARAATLRPANKAAMFDALAAAGITKVIVPFDGSGDSGQIESVDALAGQTPIDLPQVEIIQTYIAGIDAPPEPKSVALAMAIEDFAYARLRETHAGWELDDGACGDFTFDVSDRTISLDYNERYSATESYAHVF